MKIILSPAKKMCLDPDSLDCQGMPFFLADAQRLHALLKSMTLPQLKSLWKCNHQIAQLGYQRLHALELSQGLTPAILAYQGLQYQYMAPSVFTGQELCYLQQHLRILSGLYGLLRPLDGVIPYRLEMQAKLPVDGSRDLYGFWGDRLARHLFSGTGLVINLASQEYSRCISRHLPPGARLVTCVFGERKGEKIVEKGAYCKMARGRMVRYLAQNQLTAPEGMRGFDHLGYRFSPQESTPEVYVFLREEPAPPARREPLQGEGWDF